MTADSGYGDSQFRAALEERDILYSVQVKGDLRPLRRGHTSHAPGPGRTDVAGHRTRSGLAYPHDAISVAQQVLDAGQQAAVAVAWREDSKGTLTSKFVFLRVRPARHRIAREPDGSLPERWLIAEWPDN